MSIFGKLHQTTKVVKDAPYWRLVVSRKYANRKNYAARLMAGILIFGINGCGNYSNVCSPSYTKATVDHRPIPPIGQAEYLVTRLTHGKMQATQVFPAPDGLWGIVAKPVSSASTQPANTGKIFWTTANGQGLISGIFRSGTGINYTRQYMQKYNLVQWPKQHTTSVSIQNPIANTAS